MSVITFYGNSEIETSQTTSMAAIATYLSIENNYRILVINTKFNDKNLQDCFWEPSNNRRIRGDLETGINGLIKAISSNKISPEFITNYTRTIFKERLELLTDYNTPKEDYERSKECMKSIIKLSNKFYNLVFVDLKGDIEDEYVQEILGLSNLVVANTSQRIREIERFLQESKKVETLKDRNKIMILIGKYDKYSKYNIKNLQRAEKLEQIYGIPYNTLLFEKSNEGHLTDFIIKYRNVNQGSTQKEVSEAIKNTSLAIIDRLKKLQMQV